MPQNDGVWIDWHFFNDYGEEKNEHIGTLALIFNYVVDNNSLFEWVVWVYLVKGC